MAGADYLSCQACGKRLVYTANIEVIQQVGSVLALCSDCTKTNTLKSVKTRKLKKAGGKAV